MRKITLLVVVFFLSLQLFAQKDLIIHNAKSYRLKSSLNNKQYILGVSVPENYDPNKKYPVCYILDGYYTADIAHGIHKNLQFFNDIEDVIVVTIAGNEKNKNEWFINRWSDYTFTNDPKFDTSAVRIYQLPANSLLSGKGDLFLKVIKTEIIPLIENKYSTNGKRGISGHSLGGLYVGNLMFKTNDIFEKFGVNSPSFKSWNNNDIRLTEKEYSKNHTELKAKVILTFGGSENVNNINNLKEYEAILKEHYKGLDITNIIFEGETHASVVAAMISRNLMYLYPNISKK